MTEPRDQAIDRAPMNWLVKMVKKLFRRGGVYHSFETVGNYVYTLSEREIKKFALGMHYRYVAFSGVNDTYVDGVEYVQMDSEDNVSKALKKKIFRQVKILDLMSSLNFRNTGILTSVAFKDIPDVGVLKKMESFGWRVKRLLTNPNR